MSAGPGQSNLETQLLSAIESDLQSSLDAARDQIHPGIREMIIYHLGWEASPRKSGKRIRPLLTTLCCIAAGGDWEAAIPAASAVEWIHNFSLVHDDIQDQSEMRRGRPAVWKVWGTSQAINTGDAIYALSRWSTLRMLSGGTPAESVLEIHRILDEASLALTRGQHQDIAFEQEEGIESELYLGMVEGKTAALLGAACHVGVRLSPTPPVRVKDYRNFGFKLGLAFQVIDDLLGIWGQSGETGKSSLDDLSSRKKTLPIIHGLQNSASFRRLWKSGTITDATIQSMRQELEECGAREFATDWAQRYTAQAHEALQAAEPLEPAAANLRSLAARLLQRIA